jgi:hypothetical protein
MQQLMFYLLLVMAFHYVSSFNPTCSTCKWFIPSKNENKEYGLCSFYKNKYNILGKDITSYEFATHCRNNESMCGQNGYIYEKRLDDDDKNMNDIDLFVNSQLKSHYDELKNRCCGEVNEKDELEQLEGEMFEVMQKIKKHNTRNIYKTTKDLYNLFRRSKSS